MKLEPNTSEWFENIELCAKGIKEEVLPKRVLLLRAKLIEEETRSLVVDHYLEEFFPVELNSFIRLGVEDAYTNDYADREPYTLEQIQEKKK